MVSEREHVFLHDKIAKKIFKSDKLGLEYTARIVSAILGEDFEEIKKNLVPVSDKISISSLLIDSEADVTYQNDTIIIDLEINYDYGPNRKAQEFSYICQLFLGQIRSKKDYTNVKPVIQILIENYDFFKANEFLYKVVLKEEKLNLVEDINFQKYHINLEYLEKLGYTNVVSNKNELQKLLYFLVCEDEKELKEVYKGDNFMAEIIKKAREIAGLDDIPLYLKGDEIRRLDQEYHFNQGIEQGVKKNQHDMIVNFFQNGASLDLISKSAGLSIDEVKKIIETKED